MKTKNLFWGALTCLAFAACSDDNEPVVNGSGTQNEDGGQYIAVNISNPATRATAGSPAYVDGTEDETAINDVLLVFVNGSTILKAEEATVSTWGDGTVDGTVPNIEKKGAVATAYLVPSGTGGMPNGLLVILNGKSHGITETYFEGQNAPKTTQALRQLLGEYNYVSQTEVDNSTDITEKKDFIMTNSVWSENSDGVTTITSSNFADTPEKAMAVGTSVEVYVERVLAKITVNMASSFQDKNTSFDIYEGTNATATSKYIKPLILGYHLAAAVNQSYLVKSIEGSNNWSFNNWNWNDDSNYRSWWATMPTLTDDNYVYHKYSERSATNTNVTFYCNENTSEKKTELVALAQLYYVADANTAPTTSDTKVGDLVYLQGAYYNTDGFLNRIATVLSEKYTFTGTGTWDWTQKIEIKKLNDLSNQTTEKPWKIVAQLKDDVTLSGNVTAVGEAWTLDNINTQLISEYTAWMWQSGKAYYHVKIEHDGPVGTNAEFGIVRNHAYNITLNSIKGLGTPVYDPDYNYDDSEDDDDKDPDPEPEDEEEIIPEDPVDSKSYVNATVKVLKWRVLNQDVNLGK